MITFHTPLLISNDGPPLRDARISTTDQGRVISVSRGERREGDIDAGGIIIPGFVNSHAHLELSHLKGMIPPGCGMSGFIRALFAARFTRETGDRLKDMESADRLMWNEGIVAVGDISNEEVSSVVKAKSRIHYHTFIEVTGLTAAKAEGIVQNAASLLPPFVNPGRSSASLTLHAPYSFTTGLLEQCLLHVTAGQPLSVHMQESEDELQFFSSGDGPLAQVFRELGIPTGDFIPHRGRRPLLTLLPYFPRTNRLQLVHNTFTTEAEIEVASSLHPQLYWCLCPGANRYITGRIPDVEALLRQNVRITIGTDSLASNVSLSVLDELKLLSLSFPAVSFVELISWATANGAAFLGIENVVGSIRPGLTPGLLSLTGVDPENPVFNKETKLRRLC